MTEKRTNADKFMLRLPDGMRERIKTSAESNNRSMNAEIVAALEEKYPAPQPSELIEAITDALMEFAGKTPEERKTLLAEFAQRIEREHPDLKGDNNPMRIFEFVDKMADG